MKPRNLIALGAAAAAFAIPTAAAQASTVSYSPDGSTLTYTAAPGEKNWVTLDNNGDGRLYLSEYSWITLSGASDKCEFLYDTTFRYACEMPSRVVVNLGDGEDAYTGHEIPTDVTVNGGPGEDQLKGGSETRGETLNGNEGNDTVEGWKGNDTLDGGPGVDDVQGNHGTDLVQGGDGDDKLSGDGYLHGTNPDVIDGGPGKDKIDWDWVDGGDANPPLSITLGGGADDGRAGEGDDLRNVEFIDLSSRYGTFVGSEGADDIEMHQDTTGSTISGLGGNDRVLGAVGPDVVDGGTGDDYLDGGFGDDKITGGPGADRIFGDRAGGDCGPAYCTLPFGADTIYARDGEIDTIDCGASADTVYADANDIVAANCETVERSGKTTNPPPGDNPGNNNPGAASLSAKLGSIKLAKALKKGLPVEFVVSGPGKVKLTVKKGRAVVAKESVNADEGGTYAGSVPFTKAAKKSLKRARKVSLVMTVEFTPANGGAKKKATVKRTLKR